MITQRHLVLTSRCAIDAIKFCITVLNNDFQLGQVVNVSLSFIARYVAKIDLLIMVGCDLLTKLCIYSTIISDNDTLNQPEVFYWTSETMHLYLSSHLRT